MPIAALAADSTAASMAPVHFQHKNHDARLAQLGRGTSQRRENHNCRKFRTGLAEHMGRVRWRVRGCAPSSKSAAIGIRVEKSPF